MFRFLLILSFCLFSNLCIKAQVTLFQHAPEEISSWNSLQSELFNQPHFKQLAEIPDSVYVENLKEGYNSTACNGPGYTGMIDFDIYIAGVISVEMGGSFPPEALKAQAIASRSYSMGRHLQGLPVNCGQAYTANPNPKCIDAAIATSKQIILYNNQAVIVNYSARCNGDFTQNSEEGNWNGPSCGGSGSIIPYQREVSCSGHLDCTNFNEPYCCAHYTNSSETIRNLYGHGVGLCQRGAQGFANNGMKHDDILNQFYSNISISNSIPTDTTNTNDQPIGSYASQPILLSFTNNQVERSSDLAIYPSETNDNSFCDGEIVRDVWYQIELTANQEYTFEITSDQLADMGLLIYSKSDSSQSIHCIQNGNGFLPYGKWVPNITSSFLIRTWEFNNNQTGVFKLNISSESSSQLPLVYSNNNSFNQEFFLSIPNPIYNQLNVRLFKIDGTFIDQAILNPTQLNPEEIIKFSFQQSLNSGIYIAQILENGTIINSCKLFIMEQ